MRSVSNPVSLPSYIVCALLYASYALLRILKYSINILSGETEEAKASLFLAIGLMKILSTDNNDMCSKSCVYLTQLWNSSRAFKKTDGTDMLDLRARSRLNGSHVVDAILWWREEFDPHFKVQMQNLKHSALGECRTHILGLSNADLCEDPLPIQGDQAEQEQPSMDFGDTSLFDFDYFMGGDLSFPQDLFNFPDLDTIGPSDT
jgi:hypothetical protein